MEMLEANTSLVGSKLDCGNNENSFSCYCWEAFESRMSQRLSVVKSKKLCACHRENETINPSAKLSKEVI